MSSSLLGKLALPFLLQTLYVQGFSAEEVVHASLSVTAMSRVQKNLLFSSTYPQPIFNLLGVVMEHFKSLLLAIGKVCDAF